MRRKLFTLAAVLSAVLCAGVCVLWIGGYQVATGYASGDVGRRSSSGGVLTVNAILCGRGHAEFVHSWASRALLPPWLRPGWFYRTDMDVDPQTDRDTLWGKLGFRYRAEPAPFGAGEYRALFVPYWSLVVATAALPLAWLLRALRGRRTRGRGLCPTCGYDLRATPDRCPECGAVPGTGAGPENP